MKIASNLILVRTLGILLVSLCAAALAVAQASAGGQAAPAEQPPMSEEFFKNIQVLRGIPVDEFTTRLLINISH
jgi:hypothetical protein